MIFDNEVLSLLQSVGGMALNELAMRTSQEPEELARMLNALAAAKKVVISGPHAYDLEKLSARDIYESSDTFVKATMSSYRALFAS